MTPPPLPNKLDSFYPPPPEPSNTGLKGLSKILLLLTARHI